MSSKKYHPNPLAVLLLIAAILWGPGFGVRISLGQGIDPAVEADQARIAGSFPGQAGDIVTTGMAARIADVHAGRVWGGKLTPGQPFLIYDRDGLPFSYVMPYALEGDGFPSHERIFAAVRTVRAQYPRTDKRFGPALEGLLGAFGCIEVAVKRSDFPILVVRHSLHPYFLYYEEALAVAEERLGSREVALRNVEFNGPHELYFNFSSPAGGIKLHARALKPPEELHPIPLFTETVQANAPVEDETIKQSREKAWQEVDDPSYETTADTFKWIDNYALIPVVDWTHWCAPTAWTMTAGYWDHYDPNHGTWPGWGRIIDYWFDHPAICQNTNVTNVPNFIDKIISHEGTCTWSEPGLIGLLNDVYGYNFTRTDVTGARGNDWCWPNIVSEVDNGRPLVWGVGPVNGHAMTAWGYRTVGTQKFVVVYNTWGATAAEQTAEYNYEEWSGAPNTKTGVGMLWPGGGTGLDHAVLHSPRGGETLFGPSQISWFVWGDKIAYTRIYFSSDGGTSWTPVHNEWFLATASGWNTCQADLTTTTTIGRIKIECFTANLEYIAGDGSPQHFMVQGKPDLIPVPACRRDSQGNILIQVKNNGSVSAGPSVTRVTFYPSGVNDLSFPALAPGATAEVPVAVPGSCWNPDCDYLIEVDQTNSVDESDETNNSAQGACFG